MACLITVLTISSAAVAARIHVRIGQTFVFHKAGYIAIVLGEPPASENGTLA
jgi:hypothetical protein